jgi:hypothetical protein
VESAGAEPPCAATLARPLPLILAPPLLLPAALLPPPPLLLPAALLPLRLPLGQESTRTTNRSQP